MVRVLVRTLGKTPVSNSLSHTHSVFGIIAINMLNSPSLSLLFPPSFREFYQVNFTYPS